MHTHVKSTLIHKRLLYETFQGSIHTTYRSISESLRLPYQGYEEHVSNLPNSRIFSITKLDSGFRPFCQLHGRVSIRLSSLKENKFLPSRKNNVSLELD